jgi:EAL domain-containing protein (putative c-di-GMP-specific phosphodiesterase class I)
VDDDPTVLFVIAENLKRAGFEVSSAENAFAALNRLGAGPLDAVISDIAMPDMSGVELLRRVHEHDREIPVILLTGRPSMETAIQAVEYGALRYLQKPVGSAALVEAVDNAVRLFRLARWKRDALAYLGAQASTPGEHTGLEQLFSQAVDALFMAYQPILRAQGDAVYGYEALVRSSAPAMPGPGLLFDAADRLGRVHALGRLIRGRVADFTAPIPGSVSFVNLHALELIDDELYSREAPLSRQATSVVLEITERNSLEGVPDLKGRIRALRDLGYRIAIDDLGAGYAGLASFAALEPDIVKLEMAIVRGVDSDPYRAKLVSTVTAMCKDLGILVVAEGVETQAEKEALVRLGCDLLQGNLLGLPRADPA